jgi:hypothetical protein
MSCRLNIFSFFMDIRDTLDSMIDNKRNSKIKTYQMDYANRIGSRQKKPFGMLKKVQIYGYGKTRNCLFEHCT